ncbi:type I restriction endonuclease subunit R [Candidatus Nitrosotenuis aquarius]|uniref:type I restriction endonuclease subunit R n=1 Tax=Candidatus Nitrosotenuis aquarius TaxID=1846278 RepID=UPI000C1F3946|nr:type I restriction endonuclease subunit R [Candidatus Nitrosotenuis aquarius]
MVKFVVGDGDEAQESELPALELLHNLGYEYKSQLELNKTRSDYRQVLLYDRLEQAIRRLNPKFDEDGIQDALAQIREDSYPRTLDPVDTNEKIRAKLVGLSNSEGLEPITVIQNYGDGAEPKTVKLFDFENPDNNDFLVTNQFQLEGLKNPIFPDIVLFVNGIPLVVIECKSPSIPKPIEQAVEKNFDHYQTRGLGYERLFFYNHCLVATCGTLARHGTILSDVNYYARWGKAYPFEDNELERICNRTLREQEILIAGMFSKKHLLDLLENYVIYDVINNKKIKKIAKHQQYRAVTKSIARLQTSDDIADKGGVIWHTQGSGKSYTMLWFATQLVNKLNNPPIIIVTDRKQLDKQIHDTFESCGYPAPVKADSAKHLSELLANPKGKTIMTTIQKFATDAPIHTDQKAIVLVDEAHRTQFKITAESMRAAMPNAVFFAFTGTPIDKKDRNNYKVFGQLLDKYGFEESKADGATLQIRYEGRLPELFVEGGETIEQVFERVFSDLDQEMKDKLKKQYVTKGKIAEAPSRIKKIAWDLVNHYSQRIEPNGYKAMLVAPSREAAVLYKQELDKLNVSCKIIMTSHLGEKGKDDKLWDQYYLTNEQREQEAEKFKDPKDPTKILIVVDMLLVGYDAPIVQVLYLDQSLKEHNLLQAIARVNRPYDEAKTYGLIVDYCGITKDLQKALEIFEEQDIQGALEPIDLELQELRLRHLQVMSHFRGVDKNSKDEIIVKFEPIDIRDQFEYDFKAFSKALDAVMPSKESDPYIDDFKFLSMARQTIRTYYEGVKPSTKPYAKKIQQLIDDHIRSLNVKELINPMEITYENFLAFVDKFKSNRARTALVKNKAIQVIQELKGNNPAYYEKLWERLQRIIEEEKSRRKEDADYFGKYKEIYESAVHEEKERKMVFGDYEAHPFEFALYSELQEILDNRDKSIDATKAIFAKLYQETQIVGWKHKTSSEKKIMEIIYDELGNIGFPEDKLDGFAAKIIEIAKHRI